MSWLFFDKALRMGVGLFVGIWIARFLGPEQFGLLSFAVAFTSLFTAMATLGLNGVVVRDIARAPDRAALTLGTAALLQMIGGLFSFLAILAAISYVRPDDALARSIVAILGSIMLLKSSEIAIYWFESKLQSKYTVWVQNGVFLVFTVLKVFLILQESPLLAFVWAMLGEAAAVALLLFVMLNRKGPKLLCLRASVSRARTLLSDSWPLALSAIAIVIYMKIDQLMLGQLISDEAVGIYSAAVRISEIWYFIPVIIVKSVFPSILEAQQRSSAEYDARLQRLYDLMVVLSIAVTLPLMFLATPLIVLLFGEAYLDAGRVLAIHICASIFIFLGVASNSWFLAENKPILSLQRTALGAAINIMLNFWLIPLYGLIGAAVATVLSQAIATCLFDSLQAATRPMFFMKLSAMNLFKYVFKKLPES